MLAFQGELIGIFITQKHGADLQPVGEVAAVIGRGLIGDRHATAVVRPRNGEVTLIEIEALEAVARDYDVALKPDQTRRNLLTRGVPLNHLVGQHFFVGDALLRGIELAEPCAHLEALSLQGVRQALVHRGGIRARIVRGAQLRLGDVVRPAAADEQPAAAPQGEAQ